MIVAKFSPNDGGLSHHLANSIQEYTLHNILIPTREREERFQYFRLKIYPRKGMRQKFLPQKRQTFLQPLGLSYEI